MTEKPRYPIAEAEAVAQDVLNSLCIVAKRAKVLGSIRRRKPLVGDIEILYEPKLTTISMAMSEDDRTWLQQYEEECRIPLADEAPSTGGDNP